MLSSIAEANDAKIKGDEERFNASYDRVTKVRDDMNEQIQNNFKNLVESEKLQMDRDKAQRETEKQAFEQGLKKVTAAAPALIDKLKSVEGTSARCLEFTILTACRSGEARGATWDEIDLKERVWNIPAERMKAGKAHRVPLSDEAIELLRALPRMVDEQLVFSGRKENTPLSDMSLTMLLRRHVPGITAHGFRSTFRDWAAETTNYPNEVCEMALAHAVGGSVETAYRRSDLYAKRAALMKDWANYATRTVTSKLAALKRKAA
jgi:integrase